MIPKSMLGRYEYTDATSNKFWEIRHVGGDEYAARWGRIGTAGQGPKLYLESEAYNKINEKISKGYIRCTGAKMEREEARERVEKKREGVREAMDFMKELKKI